MRRGGKEGEETWQAGGEVESERRGEKERQGPGGKGRTGNVSKLGSTLHNHPLAF